MWGQDPKSPFVLGAEFWVLGMWEVFIIVPKQLGLKRN
jgi:hypothetical protein